MADWPSEREIREACLDLRLEELRDQLYRDLRHTWRGRLALRFMKWYARRGA